MIAPDRVAVVLLAAGRSVRFGMTDKLRAPFAGLPLGLHAARMLGGFGFARCFAVVGATPLDYAAEGFDAIVNDQPAAGQAHSLALGVAAAADAEAVLVLLADMPLVTPGHIRALLDRYEGRDTIVASRDEGRLSPPALFGQAHFAALLGLSGDQGARSLLRAGIAVAAPPGSLADIDTLDDLAELSGGKLPSAAPSA